MLSGMARGELVHRTRHDGCGTVTLQAVRPIARREIPAFAGITLEGAGMTLAGAVMTWVSAGMTRVVEWE